MGNLEKLTFELDYELGTVKRNVTTISDVEAILGMAIDKIDGYQHRKEESIYAYQQYHREVRTLMELVRYSLIELEESLEKAHEHHSEIFKTVRDTKPFPVAKEAK